MRRNGWWLALVALRAACAAPTWGVLDRDGANRPVGPYLSSLAGGEAGTGALRSAPFVLPAGLAEYRFDACGWGAASGFYLCDAATGEVLRQAAPPGQDAFKPVVWPVGDLAGRKVYFRAVDAVSAAGYAWLGCRAVPLTDGKPTVLQRGKPAEGWFSEVDGGLEPLGAGVARDPRQVLPREWELQDRALGVRFAPWDAGAKAALGKALAAAFARAERLSADFAQLAHERRFDAWRAVQARAAALPDDPAAARALWQDTRRALRELALANPLLPKALLFVQRFTQQSYHDINVNHHAWGSRPGGDVCLLAPLAPDGKVTPLLARRLGPGNVHGIDLSFDGRRIVFAYARAKSDEPPAGWTVRQNTIRLHQSEDLLHLYEMNVDGSNLRQLTSGPWSDLNPCYLPGGRIAFESERCGFELQCNELDKDEPTTNLFTMQADGTDIRRLSVTKDGDWYPRVLHDGRIIYSHWEYHERDWSLMHPLWVVAPDGTGANAFFKQHLNLPATLTVPRAVPRSHKVLAIATGHHTLAAGPVVLLDQRAGLNTSRAIERLTGPARWPEYNKGPVPGPSPAGWQAAPGDGWYMDPWPLDERYYLASYCDGAMTEEAGYGLYLLDVYGGKELLLRDPEISSVMPIPLAPRPEPPALPDSRQSPAPDATCVVSRIDQGMAGIAPGTVKYLRVSEPVAWPYSNAGGGLRYHPDAKATGTSWTAIRVLGTVPVAADGSVSFRVPADTALYFHALDADYREVRRMRSYVSFQPGEVRGCVGCHETRAQAPATAPGRLLALLAPPLRPEPPPWGDLPLSFLRDVQPVFDRHCVSCHGGLKPAKGLDLCGGLTAEHNRAYDTLVQGKGSAWVAVSNKHDDARISQPRQFGSARSRLLNALSDERHREVRLATSDLRRLTTWIDANAVYHDRNLDKRPADGHQPYNLAADKPLFQRLGEMQTKRCAGCHAGVNLARSEWVDLWEPARSRFLSAPRTVCAPPRAADDDADLAAMRTLVEQAVAKAWANPRRDLVALRPDRRPHL
jgi:hypothetical protein